MTRIGIAGTGRAAVLHAEAIRATPGVRLAGLASPLPESRKASATAAGLGCKVMGLQDLARRCDAAVIATPPAARLEAVRSMIASPRVRAVLMQPPVATTLDEAGRLEMVLADVPAMTGVNLLHATAVRQFLTAVAGMDPHHLELRLAVPTPEREPESARLFGGGVMTDPGAEFWPVLLAALGTAVESVAAPRVLQADGLDHTAEVGLHATKVEAGLHGNAIETGGNTGRIARAKMRWGARVAECSIEAADAAHVARTEIWPLPTTEIDGEAQTTQPGHRSSASAVNTSRESAARSGSSPMTAIPEPFPSAEHAEPFPLAALGFVAQIQRLTRVCTGESAAWPGLDVGRSALAVAVAAALSARRGGEPVKVSDAPRDASPYDILSS